MSWTEIGQLSAAILASLGGAGAIVIGFSSYLGKLWADRLMRSEKAAHETALMKLRNELEHDTRSKITALETDLSIFKDKHLRGFHDKLATYRLVIDLVAEILGDFEEAVLKNQPLSIDRRVLLNRLRLKAYGNQALLAPQAVMDAQDTLMDYLLLIAGGKVPYEWTKVRNLAVAWLNEVRKDVGIDVSPIEYRGEL